MSCHKLTYILRDSCCASYLLHIAHWFPACFSLGLCFVTVNCFPQWTRTSTSVHGAPLLWRWRLCSWELSNDRLVLTNSEYLSAVVRMCHKLVHTHCTSVYCYLHTLRTSPHTVHVCMHCRVRDATTHCSRDFWVLNLSQLLSVLPHVLWYFLLVVFMDEAGLPEESHESLKVGFTAAGMLVATSTHSRNCYTRALC